MYSTIARTGERNAVFSFLFNPDNTAYKKDSADIIRGLNHYLYSILQGLQTHIEFNRKLIYRIPLLRCRPFTKVGMIFFTVEMLKKLGFVTRVCNLIVEIST